MSGSNFTPELGAKFGRWTVIEPAVKVKSKWCSVCRCDCGTERTVPHFRLVHGTSKSCGCLQAEALTTHGFTAGAIKKHSHEYWIWNMVVQRCTNQNVPNWNDYGGRGITVCDRWLKFENFLDDMGFRPSTKHSLERRDNDAGYSPENCYWATRMEQGKNKRNNRWIEILGKRQHLAEWAREYNISHTLIIARLKRGWSELDAITTPPRPMKASK